MLSREDSSMAANAICHAAEMAQHEIAGSFSKYSLWATVYRLVPFRDGNAWCVLLGEDLATGIAGFGDTPEKAIWDFEIAMGKPVSKLAAQEKANG